jgi:integrase/recombinase XerD
VRGLEVWGWGVDAEFGWAGVAGVGAGGRGAVFGGEFAQVKKHLPATNALIHDYLSVTGHDADESGALFRPIRNNHTGKTESAITAGGVYKLVRFYSAQLGFEIGAHALRAIAATNALDHEADIAKVQEWLGHANIATTRVYDHRRSRP